MSVCVRVHLRKTPCVPLETRAVMMWTSSVGNRNTSSYSLCFCILLCSSWCGGYFWCIYCMCCVTVLAGCLSKASVPNFICLLWHMFCPWHAPVWLRANATHLYGNTVAAALFSLCHSGLRGHRLRHRGLQKAALPLGNGGVGRGDRVLRWVWSE